MSINYFSTNGNVSRAITDILERCGGNGLTLHEIRSAMAAKGTSTTLSRMSYYLRELIEKKAIRRVEQLGKIEGGKYLYFPITVSKEIT